MKIFFSIFSILTLFSISVFSQAPDTLWTKTYGDEVENDFCIDFIFMPDGGLMMTGSTQTDGEDHTNLYLIRTNSDGDTTWTQSIGGEDSEYGNCMIQTSTDGFVMAGYVSDALTNDEDFYLVRTNALGDTFWTQNYGGEEDDIAYSLDLASDFGYILAGETSSFGAGGKDIFALKTMFSGDSSWAVTIGGERDDVAFSVKTTIDLGYIIAGETKSFGINDLGDLYLIKLDNAGDTLWTKVYGGDEKDAGYDIKITEDNGFIIAGMTESYGAGMSDIYILRMDENGDTLWTRTYGTADLEMAGSINFTPDGGYIICGHQSESYSSPANMYFVKIDSVGNEEWNQTVGGMGNEVGTDVVYLPDEGYYAAGYSNSYGSGSYDAYLVRLEGDPSRLFGNQNGVLTAGTYTIAGETYVAFEDSLIVEPGVTFLTEGDFDIRVSGYFTAIGTETDSIYFLPAEGYDQWGGLVFQDNALDECEIAYCYFTGSSIGAVNIYSTNMTISHCILENNEANWGGGIYISYADPYIHDCIVSDNISHNNGGGIYATHSNPVIENCVIFGNHCDGPGSGFGGGGICYNHTSSGRIERCLIYDNYSGVNGGGISLNDYSNGEVINCTISGNETNNIGGGIFVGFSAAIIRNTIVDGNTGTTGVYLLTSRDFELEYCNIFGNELGEIDGDTLSAGLGEISTVNLNGDSCDAYFNIFLNPEYVDPVNDDYNLSENSPCIDAGDPESPMDPDSTIADIGVYFYNQGTWIEEPGYAYDPPKEFRLYGAYPNPFNASTTIPFVIDQKLPIKILIYDVLGREISKFEIRNPKLGENRFVWNAEGVSSGIYLVRLDCGSETEIGKIILLK